jgi:hypothetical protein
MQIHDPRALRDALNDLGEGPDAATHVRPPSIQIRNEGDEHQRVVITDIKIPFMRAVWLLFCGLCAVWVLGLILAIPSMLIWSLFMAKLFAGK